tara:strand:- start:372 stop:644 length:273 start_codon:yes stop_codon:yes gene_type:complete
MKETYPLFLKINARTRVIYNSLQWIIQVQTNPKARWKNIYFIASDLKMLWASLEEIGVSPPKKLAKAINNPSLTFKAWFNKKHPSGSYTT